MNEELRMKNEELRKTAGLQDCERARLNQIENREWRIENLYVSEAHDTVCSLSWISSTLRKFRLMSYAQSAQFRRYPAQVPYRNPLFHWSLFTSRKRCAFTLAEVLITLGIIGVVAAMTMPVLINKINDQEYDRARQKALASIGEAGRLIAIEGNMASETNAENFVKNVLSKKLKIAKMCDADHFADCGWTDTINVQAKGENINGDKTISTPKKISDIIFLNPMFMIGSTTEAIKDEPAYGFLTANGYSVILFYNPNCITDKKDNYAKAHDYVCMNAIYDMNGKRNPNQVGKDIGYVSVLYPDETNRAVAPNPTDENAKINNNERLVWSDANSACSGKGLSLPDVEELQSMAYNTLLTNLASSYYWSGTVQRGQAGRAWLVHSLTGDRNWNGVDYGTLVRCVRR